MFCDVYLDVSYSFYKTWGEGDTEVRVCTCYVCVYMHVRLCSLILVDGRFDRGSVVYSFFVDSRVWVYWHVKTWTHTYAHKV